MGLILGVVLGGFLPQDQYPWAYDTFRFLSKAFISLIKGLIVPLLLSTIIVGIAQTGDIRAVGRMGAKALIYFEVVTTLALFIGLARGQLAEARREPAHGHGRPRGRGRGQGQDRLGDRPPHVPVEPHPARGRRRTSCRW